MEAGSGGRPIAFPCDKSTAGSALGAEAARKLKCLGARRILIKAAELGYITQVTCGMPECFCPEELGGARNFEPRTTGELSDWEPTVEHFPIPKRDGAVRVVLEIYVRIPLVDKTVGARSDALLPLTADPGEQADP